ncbi:RluA family pseudouridine synthase [Mycoplasmopsis synoviae]|uniref:RNA pseudouridylate synthase n=1 Tax=Mycoplasmopsis synoviae (strain 53) TaxID=262723 RepID=Q4A6V6_MYCS5|nr:RluA family pseudouridine synthase [Mycoplasmopsis synoviae]AAZ43515.1 ribosomal large subunit pseudouridine synthase C [Mycoplasmopsis synoviae 53]
MVSFKASKNDENRSLFKLICKYFPNLTIATIEKLFRKKEIKVNSKRITDKKFVVSENDLVEVYGISESNLNLPQIKKVSFDFQIIYEDANILIIDKKENLVIHGEDNSLDNQVLSYLKHKQIDSFKPSHVGRLDKETSGLIVYAKNYLTLKQLNEKSFNFKKVYQFKSDFLSSSPLELKLYFYKDENNKTKISKTQKENSKLAHSIFYCENNKKFAQIITGRKHQIRLSLAYLNKPIYGDKKYKGKKSTRLMLHSYYLKFLNLEDNLKYLNKMEFYSNPKW